MTTWTLTAQQTPSLAHTPGREGSLYLPCSESIAVQSVLEKVAFPYSALEERS